MAKPQYILNYIWLTKPNVQSRLLTFTATYDLPALTFRQSGDFVQIRFPSAAGLASYIPFYDGGSGTTPLDGSTGSGVGDFVDGVRGITYVIEDLSYGTDSSETYITFTVKRPQPS